VHRTAGLFSNKSSVSGALLFVALPATPLAAQTDLAAAIGRELASIK
jgi:hypothetical protein